MADEPLKLDASRCALIIQDLQNDVIIEGGAFAESGSPEHAKEQNVVENVTGAGGDCPGEGHSRHPRALHRRGGRSGAEAQRAALQRRQGHGRARARIVGRAPRPTGWSRRTATTSSRRCG